LAFCGIARPARFLHTLWKLTIHPSGFLRFPDHCEYSSKTLSKIRSQNRSLKTEVLLTTEKDAVKLEGKPSIHDLHVYYLKIGLSIEQGFFEQILSTLDA
jgi:tetraacyldisaccharide 4'-kinase